MTDPFVRAGFSVRIADAGPGARSLRVAGHAPDGAPLMREYRLEQPEQSAYLDLFAAIARDFGTRAPNNRRPGRLSGDSGKWRPLLTHEAAPAIRYGYGDPAVIRVTRIGKEPALYHLVVTSNDAPDAFPILTSENLVDWRLASFAFPAGARPGWALAGEGVADFWAPELHRVGGEFWLCFTARERDGTLAIGIARSTRPEGPFDAPAAPLLRGGVIDAHIFAGRSGPPLLFWKEDSNGVWPRLLCRLLHEGDGFDTLFDSREDIRTAALAAAMWPWIEMLPPMEQFFALQPLIEATVAGYANVRRRLSAMSGDAPKLLLTAMRTPVYAQPLAEDGLSLVGEPHIVLVNDLQWEGHLIEGVWLTEREGLFYLFYAGNDFSTADYGIGVAVAETPLGPYRKMPQPLLRSSADWWGPGHPSVADGPGGKPMLFFHAFFPGRAGYKEFRALLAAELVFERDGVRLAEVD